MSVRETSFRWCMVIGAGALLGVAIYYLVTYVGLNIAVQNAGLTTFYQQTIRAMWIGYTLQASLLGVLFLVAAFRPHWISRPVLVICGLLPLAEAVLGMSYTGSYVLMLMLACAALFVLLGAALWPSQLAALPAATPVNSDANVTSSTAPPL
ncbi:MAG: hypothetical protein ABW136_09005 [Steroidobacteraceae bacterium]